MTTDGQMGSFERSAAETCGLIINGIWEGRLKHTYAQLRASPHPDGYGKAWSGTNLMLQDFSFTKVQTFISRLSTFVMDTASDVLTVMGKKQAQSFSVTAEPVTILLSYMYNALARIFVNHPIMN